MKTVEFRGFRLVIRNSLFEPSSRLTLMFAVFVKILEVLKSFHYVSTSNVQIVLKRRLPNHLIETMVSD
jgi:hypothetical protein